MAGWVSGIGYAVSMLDPRVCIALGAACLVAAIVVYALCASHERGGRRGFKAFVDFDLLLVAPIAKFSYLLLAFSLAAFGVAAVVWLCVEGQGRYEAGELAATSAVWVVQVAVAQVVLRVAFELSLLLVKLVENTARMCGRAACGPCGEAGAPRPAEDADAPAPAPFAGPSSGPRGAVPAVADGRPWGPGAVPTPTSSPDGPAAPAAGAPGWDAEPRREGVGDDGGARRPAAASADATAPLRPERAPGAQWDCACGAVGNTGTYCGRCGAHRP